MKKQVSGILEEGRDISELKDFSTTGELLDQEVADLH